MVQMKYFVMLSVNELAVPCIFCPACIYSNKTCQFITLLDSQSDSRGSYRVTLHVEDLLIQNTPLLTLDFVVSNMHVNDCIDLAFTPNLNA